MEAIFMALILCRITDPYECLRCDIPANKLLAYGDEYFLDTSDGAIIDFEYAYDRKWAAKQEEGMAKAAQYMEQLSYVSALHQAERDYLDKTLLDRKQWYEEDNKNIWDIDYANLGIHDSQDARKIRRSIMDNTPTKYSGDK